MDNPVQFSCYTNKSGHMDKFTIIFDGKLMMKAKLKNNSNSTQDLVASVLNEEYNRHNAALVSHVCVGYRSWGTSCGYRIF